MCLQCDPVPEAVLSVVEANLLDAYDCAANRFLIRVWSQAAMCEGLPLGLFQCQFTAEEWWRGQSCPRRVLGSSQRMVTLPRWPWVCT